RVVARSGDPVGVPWWRLRGRGAHAAPASDPSAKGSNPPGAAIAMTAGALTTRITAPRGHGIPRVQLAVLAATVLALASLLPAIFIGAGHTGKRASAREVSAYQAAIMPILRTGGQVIELGMKPG